MKRRWLVLAIVVAVLCIAQTAAAGGALNEVWYEWLVRFLLMVSGGWWLY